MGFHRCSRGGWNGSGCRGESVNRYGNIRKFRECTRGHSLVRVAHANPGQLGPQAHNLIETSVDKSNQLRKREKGKESVTSSFILCTEDSGNVYVLPYSNSFDYI